MNCRSLVIIHVPACYMEGLQRGHVVKFDGRHVLYLNWAQKVFEMLEKWWHVESIMCIHITPGDVNRLHYFRDFETLDFRGFYLNTLWFSWTLNQQITKQVILRGFRTPMLRSFGLRRIFQLPPIFPLDIEFPTSVVSMTLLSLNKVVMCDPTDERQVSCRDWYIIPVKGMKLDNAWHAWSRSTSPRWHHYVVLQHFVNLLFKVFTP